MKSIGILAAVIMAAAALVSCGSSGKHCTVTFTTNYGGASISGEELGSGSYTEDFTVQKGTALTCGIGGGGHMTVQEEKDDHTWIEIVSLDENGVTYRLRRDITDEGRVIAAKYGVQTESIDTIVHDGQCCYRKMVFSDYSE